MKEKWDSPETKNHSARELRMALNFGKIKILKNFINFCL
jgi:hypothetical protein